MHAAHSTIDATPDLREFIKENENSVVAFCTLMTHGMPDFDEMVISVFRSFGKYFRSISHSKSSAWEPLAVRIQLYRLAWQKTREHITRQLPVVNPATAAANHASIKFSDPDQSAHLAMLQRRLARLDADFRAPVVLRDIVGLDDQEACEVLQLRWGVYRHRLHRGRLDLIESVDETSGAK